jgi:hypothetical protein
MCAHRIDLPGYGRDKTGGSTVSDLRSQLVARFGESEAPASIPEPSANDAKDPLGTSAHLATPWLSALLAAAGQQRDLKVPRAPSLNAARQLHDRLIKKLKAQGRGRERADLNDLRSRYLKRREKTAWSRLKAQLSDLDVPAKLYRSLKQSGVDPEKVLDRIAKAGDARLRTMNLAELRIALVRA